MLYLVPDWPAFGAVRCIQTHICKYRLGWLQVFANLVRCILTRGPPQDILLSGRVGMAFTKRHRCGVSLVLQYATSLNLVTRTKHHTYVVSFVYNSHTTS
jgi:hypothetical protein